MESALQAQDRCQQADPPDCCRAALYPIARERTECFEHAFGREGHCCISGQRPRESDLLGRMSASPAAAVRRPPPSTPCRSLLPLGLGLAGSKIFPTQRTPSRATF